MQYTIDKAIELFKINRLTKKEVEELFQKIVLHEHGPYYAYRVLSVCPEIITTDQREICFYTLLRNATEIAKYFTKGNYSKEERIILFKHIKNNMDAIYCILKYCFQDKKQYFTLKEIAILIRDFKNYEDCDIKEYRIYESVAKSLIDYIVKFAMPQKGKYFKIMIQNFNFLKLIIFKMRTHYFIDIEKKAIYQYYSKELFSIAKLSYEKLNYYCEYFCDYITDNEKDFFVDKIVQHQDYTIIERYLNTKLYILNRLKVQFNEDQKERLQSILLMRELTKN